MENDLVQPRNLRQADEMGIDGWSRSVTDPITARGLLMPNSSPAIVTGASRGFGRAIAAALTAAGTTVVGVARDEGALELAGKELGERFIAVAGDATDEALARRLIREYQPGLLVLNAGAAPYLAPLPEQTWETFSRNWHSDTRQAFTWTQAV